MAGRAERSRGRWCREAALGTSPPGSLLQPRQTSRHAHISRPATPHGKIQPCGGSWAEISRPGSLPLPAPVTKPGFTAQSRHVEKRCAGKSLLLASGPSPASTEQAQKNKSLLASTSGLCPAQQQFPENGSKLCSSNRKGKWKIISLSLHIYIYIYINPLQSNIPASL